jgi:hypothetical protein
MYSHQSRMFSHTPVIEGLRLSIQVGEDGSRLRRRRGHGGDQMSATTSAGAVATGYDVNHDETERRSGRGGVASSSLSSREGTAATGKGRATAADTSRAHLLQHAESRRGGSTAGLGSRGASHRHGAHEGEAAAQHVGRA